MCKTKMTKVLIASLVLLIEQASAHAVVPKIPLTVPAEKIAYAGHGMLFDRKMRKIKLDTSLITVIQDSMLYEILKDEILKGKHEELLSFLKEMLHTNFEKPLMTRFSEISIITLLHRRLAIEETASAINEAEQLLK